MIRDKCVVCDSKEINDIIDLGMHPFADTFVPKEREAEPDLIYPLVCSLCNNCGHVQNKYETNPLQRYSQIEYSYTSSNSKFARDHWEKYAEDISKELNLKNGFVVEAGSNDGYLSEQFLKKGNKVLGVDPSPYMATLAKQRNVPTITGLFGTKYVKEILLNGKADLVIANNVFNHSDNPLDFVKAVSEILKEDGSFIFEQPYWIDTLKTGKFDQIYHEHVSYFTVKSAKALLERAGLVIKSTQVVNYHGGSLRIIAQKKTKEKDNENVKKLIDEEQKYGAFNIETYKRFMDKLNNQRSKFLQLIYSIKEKNIPLIAVGAAAKGNTFLNFYKLDSTIVNYVTDASPHKKGKYTPATRIPIVGDEIFSKFDEVYAIILSWNIANQLKDILSKFNQKINFISPDNH